MEEYRDSPGRLSIELSGDDGQFVMFAERLEKFGGRVKVQLDGLDARDWDFDLNCVSVVLHSDPMAGVSLHLEDGSNDDLLCRIAAACLRGRWGGEDIV